MEAWLVNSDKQVCELFFPLGTTQIIYEGATKCMGAFSPTFGWVSAPDPLLAEGCVAFPHSPSRPELFVGGLWRIWIRETQIRRQKWRLAREPRPDLSLVLETCLEIDE